jgi:hypothetical protein
MCLEEPPKVVSIGGVYMYKGRIWLAYADVCLSDELFFVSSVPKEGEDVETKQVSHHEMIEVVHYPKKDTPLEEHPGTYRLHGIDAGCRCNLYMSLNNMLVVDNMIYYMLYYSSACVVYTHDEDEIHDLKKTMDIIDPTDFGNVYRWINYRDSIALGRIPKFTRLFTSLRVRTYSKDKYRYLFPDKYNADYDIDTNFTIESSTIGAPEGLNIYDYMQHLRSIMDTDNEDVYPENIDVYNDDTLSFWF